ncbi:MAG: RidA family protein [Alphaproteobacteria bacterium]|nr:RidA family protein [Alphaproteobacteria bacterium]
MSKAAIKQNANASAEAQLKALNITLPAAGKPAARYVPATQSGNIVYVSGQLPFINGELIHKGQLGANISIEQGQETARNCALNILAHLRAICDGNLDKVTKVLKLEILVSSAQGFTDQHVVANGASNLIADIFGDEIGSHARVAYGVAGLPMGVAVEVAGTFEVA